LFKIANVVAQVVDFVDERDHILGQDANRVGISLDLSIDSLDVGIHSLKVGIHSLELDFMESLSFGDGL
jgi:hypothetical protein